MSIIKGGDLMLFVGGESIGYATSHTLSINADTKETSSKDAGGKWLTSEVGLISWSGSSENLYANEAEGKTFDDLFTLMIARTPVAAVFSVKSENTDTVPLGGWTSSGGYSGNIIITSLEANATNGENATFTMNFVGTGALSKVA